MDKSLMDSLHPASGLDKDDPFEAIFALNMGDFVTEHLISDDLLNKISNSLSNDPDKLRKQLNELIEIYSLNNTLSLLGFSSNQESVLYDSIAMSLIEMLQVDACHIFQTMYKDDKPHFLSLTGTSVSGVPKSRWNIGYELFDNDQLMVEVYDEGFPAVYDNVTPDLPNWKPLLELGQDKTRSFIAIPMQDAQKQVGLILFECYEAKDFTQETVDLAESTARVFVTSLNLQRLLTQAQNLVNQPEAPAAEMLSLRAQITESIADLGRYQQFFVESLAFSIDARNEFSHGHSQGVALIAKNIAEDLNLNEKTVDLVYYAGLLGSLGKIHIPQEILTKEEALTPDEMESLKNSPNMGVGLLMKMNFLAEVIPYVDYKKERWDGKDSPHGLSGRSIPLGARIIAVADAFHALTHPRPYREQPLAGAEALKILQSEAGTKWDPDIVASLLRVFAASSR